MSERPDYDHDLDLLREDEPSESGILSKTLRNIGVITVVGVTISFVIGGYSEDIQDAAQQADQPVTQGGVSADGNADIIASSEMQIRANHAGHFLVDGEVERARIRFLVDTGATMVVLSPADAERAGFTPDRLSFSQEVSTANGTVRVAPVTLRKFKVGQIVLRNVDAVVNSAPMRVSLLGMSFLKRLDGWQVKGDKLYLAW